MMRLFGEEVFVKTGAEGVFCAALPRYGLGIAVKADDGGSRAAEVITAALIDAFLPMSDEQRASLQRYLGPEIRNWNGALVGGLRPAEGWLPRR
jgi:L-asparaginase II